MTKASAAHVPPLPRKLARASDEVLLARLEEIAAERERLDALLNERLAIFGALVERGVTHVKIASHAKVTKMAVAFALRPPETRRGKAK